MRKSRLRTVLLCDGCQHACSTKSDHVTCHQATRSHPSSEMDSDTHICPIEPETSVHTASIWLLSRWSANACRVGSGSDRKPTRPAAEARPTMMRHVGCIQQLRLVSGWRCGGSDGWAADGNKLQAVAVRSIDKQRAGESGREGSSMRREGV